MLLTRVVHDPRRRTFGLLLQIWAMVATYAVLHDQYVIRVAPEHFTIYHRPLWGIQNPTLLAATWALLASLAPGMLLGTGCLLAARVGARPPLPARLVRRAIFVLLVATELCCIAAGSAVYLSGRGIFPKSFYVDAALPLLITQTVQITCYGAGALLSCGMLGGFLWLRRRSVPASR